MDIGPGEWIIVGIVLLLVFGSNKIPQLARNPGRVQNELKKGLAEGRADTPPPDDTHRTHPDSNAPLHVSAGQPTQGPTD